MRVRGLRVADLRGRMIILNWGNTVEQPMPGQPNNRIMCGTFEEDFPLFDKE